MNQIVLKGSAILDAQGRMPDIQELAEYLKQNRLLEGKIEHSDRIFRIFWHIAGGEYETISKAEHVYKEIKKKRSKLETQPNRIPKYLIEGSTMKIIQSNKERRKFYRLMKRVERPVRIEEKECYSTSNTCRIGQIVNNTRHSMIQRISDRKSVIKLRKRCVDSFDYFGNGKLFSTKRLKTRGVECDTSAQSICVFYDSQPENDTRKEQKFVLETPDASSDCDCTRYTKRNANRTRNISIIPKTLTNRLARFQKGSRVDSWRQFHALINIFHNQAVSVHSYMHDVQM
ncbi:hypothetical protein ECANGB1_1199 [Enterospora canceri]|uniref:Uncharacterized protein n=1 Tax=Enterospora canceri TaxID=1081671 RepID=A0A1Y1S6F6_9MICR|nr:hypothetical protein ECANGB1_1199 [Enterospora canceri]